MRLDIVIPAHNEQDRIARTLRAYSAVLTDPSVRFHVALDQCTDRTVDVVREQAVHDERIVVHEYPKLGKGGVVMETFRRCGGDVIGFVDADCSTPPAEYLRLVDVVAAGADVAIASRWHPSAVVPRPRSRARRATSSVFPLLVAALFRLGVRDTQCGAKVARRAVLDTALPLLSSRDFLFDVDLLVVASHFGYRVIEVPTVWVDRDGSHLHPFADARRMAASSFRLWLHHRVLPLPAPGQREAVVDAEVIDLRDHDAEEVRDAVR
ncbi:MAG: glycosyltransferase [Acidobacteria bacterium]|nr:glycosyltransferase [Acidobacteriota bacterium]